VVAARAPAPYPQVMISIASWNINSVRLRIEQVARVLREQAVDVLCLQEIKCQEHQFPAEALAGLGYVFQAVHGQKGYHGVATVSRLPFRELHRHDWQDNGEARHVGVELTGAGKGLVIENVYIPAGGDTPDREVNAKFGQKLDFLERMTRWAHGWVDLGRRFIPAPKRNYSWWSYRAFWRERDQGRRLDHMWASPELAPHAASHRLVEETRRWDSPSDHVPLVTEFDL